MYEQGKPKSVMVPISEIQKGPYRHSSFGEVYRPFFERMSRLFADVSPGTPEEWEDDFRRDSNPEQEMALWQDVARCFEHFTEEGNWDLDRKKELFEVLMAYVCGGPRVVLRELNFRHLRRAQAKEIVAFLRASGVKVRPIVVG